MKTLLMSWLFMSAIFTINSCDTPQKKEEPGIKVEGKKGGDMEINKDKMEIEGKKGGELKIDSNGVKVKNPNANK